MRPLVTVLSLSVRVVLAYKIINKRIYFISVLFYGFRPSGGWLKTRMNPKRLKLQSWLELAELVMYLHLVKHDFGLHQYQGQVNHVLQD